MNWDAIGAVGELLSALAVVVSLLYLASQIRTQNREARMAAMHETAEGFRESIGTLSDPQKADIFMRANRDFDGLTEAEQLVTLTAMQRMLRLWEEAFHQHREGRLDTRIWDTMNRQYAALLGAGAFRRTWELRRDLYDEEFRTFVDALPASGPYSTNRRIG